MYNEIPVCALASEITVRVRCSAARHTALRTTGAGGGHGAAPCAGAGAGRTRALPARAWGTPGTLLSEPRPRHKIPLFSLKCLDSGSDRNAGVCHGVFIPETY